MSQVYHIMRDIGSLRPLLMYFTFFSKIEKFYNVTESYLTYLSKIAFSRY